MNDLILKGAIIMSVLTLAGYFAYLYLQGYFTPKPPPLTCVILKRLDDNRYTGELSDGTLFVAMKSGHPGYWKVMHPVNFKYFDPEDRRHRAAQAAIGLEEKAKREQKEAEQAKALWERPGQPFDEPDYSKGVLSDSQALQVYARLQGLQSNNPLGGAAFHYAQHGLGASHLKGGHGS